MPSTEAVLPQIHRLFLLSSRLIIQSREEYAATMTHDPSDTPGLSSGHQFGAGVTHDPSDTPGPSREHQCNT